MEVPRAEYERLRIVVGNQAWRIRDLEAQLRDAQSVTRALKAAHEELQQVFLASNGAAVGKS